jgi:hypothetical protein
MCLRCNWEKWLQTIDEMTEAEDDRGHSVFDWADETLTNICVWVQEHQHITDKQKQAIRNIANSMIQKDRWDGELPD